MALKLYPPSAHNVFHGVNIQYPQHVDQAVQQIYAACKGMGTDEQTLISVLGSKSPEARTLIAMRYQALYNKPLKELIKGETSGDFGRLLRMISTPLHETEAQLLYDATKGMGTNESQITQIVAGRTNAEMDILKKTYFRLFNKDLTVTLNSELSGDFKKVVIAMLQSQQEPFNPSIHTAVKAEDDAVQLYKAGQGRMGTNEEVFIGILVKCPTEYLKMMDAAYVRKYNNNIAKAIDKEFSGDAKKALNYLVKSVMDPYPTIAELFESTMKGFGTRETALSTAIVRYHCVLPGVKQAFKKLYGKELRDRINGETSGDYRRLLLEIYDAPQDAGVNAVPAGAKPAAPVPGVAPPGAAPTGYPAPASYGAAQPPTPGLTTAYPAPAGQTTSGGYPPAAQGYPASGHPPAHGAAPGYPPQQTPAPGYPAQQTPAPGYPPHQPAPTGYPAPPAPAPGYPPHQPAPSGYPAQQQPAPGYPPHQPAPTGYPPPQAAAGYPPHQPVPAYPAQQAAYPAHGAAAPGAYPPQGQYPPQAAPGYPPQQQQYPPAAQGYPPQGYPPAAQGYPPQAYPPQGQYPPQAYPPQGQYPPQSAPGYPPQQGYPGYRY